MTRLAQFFDWPKGTAGRQCHRRPAPVSRHAPLPDKAILITFDDGYKSLYTRVFPLLKVYRSPIVSALVGIWMEGELAARSYGGDRRARGAGYLLG
jgi:peptidoglycan/xylan/chitin deacetylase (PgdA/CDA1 family)